MICVASALELPNDTTSLTPVALLVRLRKGWHHRLQVGRRRHAQFLYLATSACAAHARRIKKLANRRINNGGELGQGRPFAIP